MATIRGRTREGNVPRGQRLLSADANCYLCASNSKNENSTARAYDWPCLWGDEAADKFRDAAMEFAAERRREVDVAVKRMKDDAAAAEEKLGKLARAGAQSWSTLGIALTETRAAFDRANQAVNDAFMRVINQKK